MYSLAVDYLMSNDTFQVFITDNEKEKIFKEKQGLTFIEMVEVVSGYKKQFDNDIGNIEYYIFDEEENLIKSLNELN